MKTPKNILIIADDFTGANDTGVKFAKKGYDTSVINNDNLDLAKSDILVVNTETRLIDEKEAVRRIENISKYLENQKIYKKIDSTFRGNIGAEIETLLSKLNKKICVIANAFPSMNRTVQNGISYVAGTPLNETDFAKDPVNPIKTSNIAEILKISDSYNIKNIGVDDILSGKFDKEFKSDLKNNKKVVYICDGEKEEDLISLSKIVYKYLDTILCVGCADFADALMHNIGDFLPICFVSGSLSSKSILQLNKISDKHAQIIDINKDLFFSNNIEELKKDLNAQIEFALKQKKHIIISVTINKEDREENKFYAEKYSISEEQMPEYISNLTAKLVKYVISYTRIKALFVSGGNTAIHIIREFNANEIKILGEIENGVPYGIILDGEYPCLQIGTKAGGFGNEDLYLDVMKFYDK